MSSGINSVLNIGKWALFSFQSAIATTGQNISNVDTPGYSRQEVRFDEARSIDGRPGQLGQGVLAVEVMRHFDQYVESSYNDAASLRERFSSASDLLSTIETVINEANTDGLSSTLSQFFKDWQNLSLRPADYPSREALLANTASLLSAVNQVNDALLGVQSQADAYIEQDVNRANELIKDIADLNKQIAKTEVPGVNNANQLRDDRAQMVRELAEIMDVNYIDNGGGNITITTKGGQTLVDGFEHYELKFESSQSEINLTPASTYTGGITVDGKDDYEYTIQFVNGGAVGTTVPPAAGTAQFKVSLDGGKTWVKDPDTGADQLFYAMDGSNKVRVGDLDISFDAASGSFASGDKVAVVPKSGVYWYKNSSDKVNITPQQTLSGVENSNRLVGGSLAGYFNLRDNYIGGYKDKLDSFAKSLIWETNRLHSQGAGLAQMEQAAGTYGPRLSAAPLGDPSAGLAFGDKLQSGSFTLYLYDSATGKLSANGEKTISFLGIDTDPTTPGVQDQANFDPSKHSLDDVVTAINNSFPGGEVVASKGVNNQLQLTSDSTHSFLFGADSTGLMAGLGLNTFFTGDSAGNIGVNAAVANNLANIAGGHVNGAGEANSGDNTTAGAIAGLQDKKVSVYTKKEGTSSQTLIEYYDGLIANVGADKSYLDFNLKYQTSLATDLQSKQDQVAGVNLDEEMSNLIKYQHSYQAAAKLISTADQMLQTLLGIKS